MRAERGPADAQAPRLQAEHGAVPARTEHARGGAGHWAGMKWIRREAKEALLLLH